jgi:drug/metabolite transporter (DMT)-like permease
MNEKKDILTKTWVVAVLASICCMLWGSAFSCVKIGYSLMNITTNDSGSQLVFGGIRFFVAGLMALAMGSGAERKILLPTKTSIPKIMIISLFQTILQYFFYYIGLAHTTGVKAAIIVGANVFIAILGMEVFVGRRIFLSAPLPMARAISPATKNLMPPNTS